MDDEHAHGTQRTPDEGDPAKTGSLGRGLDALLAEGAAESTRRDGGQAGEDARGQADGGGRACGDDSAAGDPTGDFPVPPWRERRRAANSTQVLIPARTAFALYAGSLLTALLTAAVILVGAFWIAASLDGRAESSGDAGDPAAESAMPYGTDEGRTRPYGYGRSGSTCPEYPYWCDRYGYGR